MSLLPNSFYTHYYWIQFKDDKGVSRYINASKKCQHVPGFLNVDVCMELFNRIKPLETESSTLIYDITPTYFLSAILHIWLWHCRYKHHFGVAGWASVEDSLDELCRILKTTLDFGGESSDKISNFPFPLFESFLLFLRCLPLDSKLLYSLLREETFGKYLWSYLNLEHRVSIFSDFCVISSTLVGSADDEYQEYKYVSEKIEKSRISASAGGAEVYEAGFGGDFFNWLTELLSGWLNDAIVDVNEAFPIDDVNPEDTDPDVVIEEIGDLVEEDYVGPKELIIDGELSEKERKRYAGGNGSWRDRI